MEKINCPVERTMQILGNKWTILILKELFEKTMRFNEFQKKIPGISTKMLAQQLKKLEKDKIVRKKIYPEVPPKVEYSLTDKGRTLDRIIFEMKKWGEIHIED